VLETTEKDAKFVLEQKAKDISANIQVQLLPDASVGEKTWSHQALRCKYAHISR
jgi:hypothetical protein